MIETIFYTICLVIVIPIVVYLIAKAATFGYYSGKHMYDVPQDKDNNQKKEQNDV